MKTKNTNKNTQSIIDINEEITRQFTQASNIEMRYFRGKNNTATGNIRTETTLKIAVRFGLTSITILSIIYKMKPRQVREHLNKLVKKNYLTKIESIRSVDNCVYVPTKDAVQLVRDLLDVQIYFRRTKSGLEINQNTVNHDSIAQLVLLQSLELSIEYDDGYYRKHLGLVTEHEIKKIIKQSNLRIVDGILIEYDPENDQCITVGIEIEHSFKHPRQRSEILLSYLKILRAKVCDDIMLVSHSKDILKDAQRINDKLIVDLCEVRKKDGSKIISGEDASLLEAKLRYNDTYCKSLTAAFYR